MSLLEFDDLDDDQNLPDQLEQNSNEISDFIDELIIDGDYDEDIKNLVHSINRGIRGENQGVPFGIPDLDRELNIRQKMMVTIGGSSSSGKTAVTDDLFLIRLFINWLAAKEKGDSKFPDIHWNYFSMERSKEYKYAKWLGYFMFILSNGAVKMSVDEILSWKRENRITPIVRSTMLQALPYLNYLKKLVFIYERPKTPQEIIDLCCSFANSNGTNIVSNVSFNEFTDSVSGDVFVDGYAIGQYSNDCFETIEGRKRFYCDINLNGKTERIYAGDSKYIAKNKNVLSISLFDHLGKLRLQPKESGYGMMDRKETCDYFSGRCGDILRDYYGQTIGIVSQFNRNVSDLNRVSKVELRPIKEDWKDTSCLIEDCDVALGILNPYERQDMNHLGYKVEQFNNSDGHNTFRSLWIVKNSYGGDNIPYGFNFIGSIGRIQKLPPAVSMTPQMYGACRAGLLF